MIAYALVGQDGEKLEFTATARDVFMWEKAYKGKSFGQLKDNLHMWDLYAIAHLACKRLGHTDLALDPFVDAYPDLDWREMAKQPIAMEDPTQPAQSAGE